jgi:hypothetical protein
LRIARCLGRGWWGRGWNGLRRFVSCFLKNCWVVWQSKFSHSRTPLSPVWQLIFPSNLSPFSNLIHWFLIDSPLCQISRSAFEHDQITSLSRLLLLSARNPRNSQSKLEILLITSSSELLDAAPLSAPTTSAMIKVIFMKSSLEIASTFAPSIVGTGMENSDASVFCLPLNSITFSSLFIPY